MDATALNKTSLTKWSDKRAKKERWSTCTLYEASQWRARLTSLGRLHTLPLRILRMLERYEQAYAEAVAFIQHPPDDLELMLIGPKSPLCSQVIGSRTESLLADYEIGKNDGLPTAERLSRWLESDTSVRQTGQIEVVEQSDSIC